MVSYRAHQLNRIIGLSGRRGRGEDREKRVKSWRISRGEEGGGREAK